MSNYEEQAREWLADGAGWDQIRENLMSAGLDESGTDQIVGVLREERTVRNRNRGMALLMIGAALCFGSMLFTFLVGHNYFVLYGLTMIGVTIAFAGLVYIMG